MNEVVTNSPRLDQPAKRTIWRKLRAIIWTIGIIAVSFACLVLWIEYRKFRQVEFLTDIKNAGVRVHSWPVPYEWTRPLLSDKTTKSIIESVSPLEYDANLVGDAANKDAIRKALALPNLTKMNVVYFRSLEDESLSLIAQSPSLRELHLMTGKISENGISLLAGMSHLERLSVQDVPLSEKGLAALLKMNQLKDLTLGQNGIDLIDGFSFEAKGSNESKDIQVGDIVTFTGSFRSAKIIPTMAILSCSPWAVSCNVTQLEKGTFQFVLKAPAKMQSPGVQRIYLNFYTPGSPRIGFPQAVEPLTIADVAKPSSGAPKPLDMGKIEGKVEIKEGPIPK
jgi:hypothetical protein